MTTISRQVERASFNASIHGARGLFSLMVFVYHIIHSGLPGLIPDDAWISVYLLNSLKFGVELFFGISGFVILGALARAPSIRSFLWDRATRIYPLLWMTLLAITLASLASHAWMPSLRNWLLNFLAPPPFFPLPQVNPSAWSIGYELTFYALCAIVWPDLGRGRSRWLVATLGIVLLILFPRAILFPAGLAIGAGVLRRRAVRPLLSFAPAFLIIFLLAWRAIELAHGGDMMQVNPLDLPFVAWLATVPLLIGAGMCGALSLAGIASGRGVLATLLRTAPLQWCGTVSFSFYLWHPVVLSPIKHLLRASGAAASAGIWAQTVFAVLALPVALVIAHFSQVWIEAKLTRQLRRFGPAEGHAHTPITATIGTATGIAT